MFACGQDELEQILPVLGTTGRMELSVNEGCPRRIGGGSSLSAPTHLVLLNPFKCLSFQSYSRRRVGHHALSRLRPHQFVTGHTRNRTRVICGKSESSLESHVVPGLRTTDEVADIDIVAWLRDERSAAGGRQDDALDLSSSGGFEDADSRLSSGVDDGFRVGTPGDIARDMDDAVDACACASNPTSLSSRCGTDL